MNGFIYLWLDKKKKMYYIGSHLGSIDDGYICSSRWMRAAYQKRPEDFKRRIIKQFKIITRRELYNEEQRWLNFIKKEEIKVRYYNLFRTVNYAWADEENNKTLKEKISQKTKEAMQRPKVREKYLNGLKSRNTHASEPDVIERKRQAIIKTLAIKFPNRKIRAKLNSEEHRRKNAEGVKKAWANRSPEEKQIIGNKIRNSGAQTTMFKLGVELPKSKEHKEKISQSHKLRWLGKTKTPEEKKELRRIWRQKYYAIEENKMKRQKNLQKYREKLQLL